MSFIRFDHWVLISVFWFVVSSTPQVAEAQVTQEDSLALVDLYIRLDGPNWINKTGWREDRVGNWNGITIANRRVTGIDLSGNQLSGSLSAAIAVLDHLQVFALPANNLLGTIPPELSEMDSLRVLVLANNQFTGSIPATLGELPVLEVLALANNKLSGSIPPELGRLSNLRNLDLFKNLLEGPIPPALGDLNNLRALFLTINRLTGPIPAELGKLEQLQTMYLSRNFLDASIPSALSELDNLRILDLSFNNLSGPVPPAIGQLQNLEVLWLFDNMLGGELPDSLGALTKLKNFNIANNSFSGEIPLAFSQLLSLNSFNFMNTALCVPGNPAIHTWLEGIGTLSDNGIACQPTSNEKHPVNSTDFSLQQNYPNPFLRETTLSYNLATSTHVQLKIYNQIGKEVGRIVDAFQTAGAYELNLNLAHLPAGLYVYQLQAGQISETRQMVLLR